MLPPRRSGFSPLEIWRSWRIDEGSVSSMSRVAIVTGGAGGIGAPLCRALAEDRYSVVVADFAEDAGKALAEELTGKNGQAQFYKIDVREKSGADRLAAQTVERYGKIDVLINGAGVMSRAPVLELRE